MVEPNLGDQRSTDGQPPTSNRLLFNIAYERGLANVHADQDPALSHEKGGGRERPDALEGISKEASGGARRAPNALGRRQKSNRARTGSG